MVGCERVCEMNLVRHSPARWLAALATGTLVACVQTPDLYEWSVDELEERRGSLERVGVVIDQRPAESVILLPARGRWGGFKRGMVIGAAYPMVIGFLSPVPGGFAVGALLAPLTGLVGAFYGMAHAVPPEEVDRALEVITRVEERLLALGLRGRFLAEVERLGLERTGLAFVVLEPAEDGSVDTSEVDAVLEIQGYKGGLRGQRSIDPKMASFVQVDARLVCVSGGGVLFEETFSAACETRRSFVEWTTSDGQGLFDEFMTYMPEIAEKIIDDFFLILPLPAQ
jgi:hypothetical protein